MHFWFGYSDLLTPASQALLSNPVLWVHLTPSRHPRGDDPCQPSFPCFPKISTLNLDEGLSLLSLKGFCSSLKSTLTQSKSCGPGLAPFFTFTAPPLLSLPLCPDSVLPLFPFSTFTSLIFSREPFPPYRNHLAPGPKTPVVMGSFGHVRHSSWIASGLLPSDCRLLGREGWEGFWPPLHPPIYWDSSSQIFEIKHTSLWGCLSAKSLNWGPFAVFQSNITWLFHENWEPWLYLPL